MDEIKFFLPRCTHTACCLLSPRLALPRCTHAAHCLLSPWVGPPSLYPLSTLPLVPLVGPPLLYPPSSFSFWFLISARTSTPPVPDTAFRVCLLLKNSGVSLCCFLAAKAWATLSAVDPEESCLCTLGAWRTVIHKQAEYNHFLQQVNSCEPNFFA